MAVTVLAACSWQGALGLSPHASVPALADATGFAFAAQNGALVVLRPANPLTYADGLPAKRAALSHCSASGGQLNPAAFGQFNGGAWAFAGGCA